MAAITALQGYGGDSSDSSSDNEQDKEDMTLHLKPIEKEQSVALLRTDIAVSSAPAVATKVSEYGFTLQTSTLA